MSRKWHLRKSLTRPKPAEKSDKWDVKDAPAKPAAKPAVVAEAPKAKEAAPWDLDSTKGVDIDLNIKMPWQKDKAAPKPTRAANPPLSPAVPSTAVADRD